MHFLFQCNYILNIIWHKWIIIEKSQLVWIYSKWKMCLKLLKVTAVVMLFCKCLNLQSKQFFIINKYNYPTLGWRALTHSWTLICLMVKSNPNIYLSFFICIITLTSSELHVTVCLFLFYSFPYQILKKVKKVKLVYFYTDPYSETLL